MEVVRTKNSMRPLVVSKGQKKVLVERGIPRSVIIGEDAEFDYILLGEVPSESRISISVGKNSKVNFLDGRFISGVCKFELDILLNGESADVNARGFYIVNGDGQLEIATHQQHRARDTKSSLIYKGVLAGHGRSTFKGLITIEKNAEGSDGNMENRNLILSDRARADSYPYLEILTDNVKCTHRVSLGAVSVDELFYLASRGIDEQNATDMLVAGYLNTIATKFVPHVGGEVNVKIEEFLNAKK